MSAEGWICPLCHCGVAPSELRCPCAGQQVFGGTPLPWPPNPDETLRFVKPYYSHVELDGCYCYACVEERARKMGLTWFTTAPQTVTPSEPSTDPANYTEAELQAMHPGQRFAAMVQAANSHVVQSK